MNQSPLGRRLEPYFLGAGVATFVAAMLAIAAHMHGSAFLYRHDALFSYRVALDPFGRGASFAGLPADSGVAYRYGRILYPLLGWLLAGGARDLIRWTLALVYAVSVGAVVTLAALYCRDRGKSALYGTTLLLAPVFVLTLPIVYPEPLVIALALLVYRLHGRGQIKQAIAVAALLLLAREAAVLALIPLVWRDVRRLGIGGLTRWVFAAVPLVLWFAWVKLRIGSIPIADPAPPLRDTLGGPFWGVAYAIRNGRVHGAAFVLSFAMGVTTLLLAGVAVARSRWYPITNAAVIYSVLVIFFGPAAVLAPAETIRLMMPGQMFAILALVASSREAVP